MKSESDGHKDAVVKTSKDMSGELPGIGSYSYRREMNADDGSIFDANGAPSDAIMLQRMQSIELKLSELFNQVVELRQEFKTITDILCNRRPESKP